MSVECYALVTFKRELTKEDKKTRKTVRQYAQEIIAQDWQGDLELRGSRSTIGQTEETELHLCHLQLVQPLGKNGRVPIPRWEVVEKLLSQNQCRQDDNWDELRTRDGAEIHIGYLWSIQIYKNDVPFLCSYERMMIQLDEGEPEYHYDLSKFMTIDDKRIQLSQIRSLFPECVKMPMWMALDYVRDRI